MQDMEAIQSLLSAGADIYQKNLHGESSVEYGLREIKGNRIVTDLETKQAIVQLLYNQAAPKYNWEARRSLILLKNKIKLYH